VSCNTYKAKTKEKRMMDYNDFKIVIERIKKYAIRASLYDMGEPLLNKNIYKMIRYCSDRKISTLISTNFNLFCEEDIDKLFNSCLTILEPCLDGFTQENYVKYRRGGNVNTVKAGIKLVMDHKIKNEFKYPIVEVPVVLFDHIMNELQLIQNFLEQCKVDRIVYCTENLGFNSPQTSQAYNQITNNSACFWLYMGMMIRPDGSTYACCGRDFDRFSYGNILKQEISEIWNNECYRFSRSLFSIGPPLKNDEKFVNIPCIKCNLYSKKRKVKYLLN